MKKHENSKLYFRSGFLALALVGLAGQSTAWAGQATVDLRSASTFAVLASSTVTTIPQTTIYGDLGVWTGTAITGAPIVTGSQHAGDPTAAQAQADLTTAYNDAAGRDVNPILIAGNLGGLTLAPGLYRSSSSLAISSGDLTLDAQGDPNAVWIFQIASTLTTTAGRLVILANGANANNVFWQVGSSATLGTNSDFKGTIMSFQATTLNTGATLRGRAFARNAAVALDANTIKLPNTAASSFSGKTLVATITSGTGTLTGTGRYQFVAATGNPETYRLVTRSGGTQPSSGNYIYVKPSATLGQLTFDGITMTLDFATRTTGKFRAEKNGGTQSGTFTISRTLADVNNDGYGDIYTKGGSLRGWRMEGTEFLGEVFLRNGFLIPNLKVIGQGDFNRDGKADIAFLNKVTGTLEVWIMNGTQFLSSAPIAEAPPVDLMPVAVADFNGDGHPDILLEREDRVAVVWLMRGTSLFDRLFLRSGFTMGPAWRIVGTGDFNGDYETDVVWENPDGRVVVWTFDGVVFYREEALKSGPGEIRGWKIRGVADFDFDGETDLLHQNIDGRTAFWFFNDAKFLGIELGRALAEPNQTIIGPN